MEIYLAAFIGGLIVALMFLYGEFKHSEGYADGHDDGYQDGKGEATGHILRLLETKNVIRVERTGVYRLTDDGEQGEILIAPVNRVK